MKDHMKQTPPQPQVESIRDRVFSTIEEQNVEPRPCYVFWCQNSAMWLIWLVTVLLGALATAVLVFTSTYRYYDMYEAMHDNFITFFLQALPVLWIVAFIVLMLVAMQGIRATRRGYRLSPTLVGGSSVGLSVVLGILVSSMGFGLVVDQMLGEYAPMYNSAAKREQGMWQQPDQGRLLGRATNSESELGVNQVEFTDSRGQMWLIDTQELRAGDRDLLQSQKRVRVLGTQLDEKDARFHACGVFPWMLDKQRPMQELSAERKKYLEKMFAHMDSPVDRMREFEREAFDNVRADNVPSMKICAEIAAVRRISEQMQ